MSKKKREIAGTVADATLPRTPIEIDGVTYQLCCDLGALSEAETKINIHIAKSGGLQLVNLLAAMADENLTNTRIMFAAALRRFHPEVDFEAARAMVRRDNVFIVVLALRDAWAASMPEKKPNPPGAQAAK